MTGLIIDLKLEKVAQKTGKIVTVEEHSIIGGLGSAVAEVLSEQYPVRMLRIGIKDTFGESKPAIQLLKKYGLDADGIYQTISIHKTMNISITLPEGREISAAISQ